MAGGHYRALAIVTGYEVPGLCLGDKTLAGGQYLISSDSNYLRVLPSRQRWVSVPKSEGDAPSYSDTALQAEHSANWYIIAYIYLTTTIGMATKGQSSPRKERNRPLAAIELV